VPISRRSQLLSARRNPQKAGQVLEELFPDTHVRGLVTTILGDAIQTAARVAPKSWGVSLFPSRLCLNVGRGAVLQLCPNRIVFIATRSQMEGLPRRVASPAIFSARRDLCSRACEETVLSAEPIPVPS